MNQPIPFNGPNFQSTFMLFFSIFPILPVFGAAFSVALPLQTPRQSDAVILGGLQSHGGALLTIQLAGQMVGNHPFVRSFRKPMAQWCTQSL